jgi:iron complex outermembrane receptor protein
MALALHLAVAGAMFAAAMPSAHAQAAAAPARAFNIPAGTLTAALNRFAEEAGVFLSAPAELTQGKNSAGLAGSFTVDQAFAELLRGQNLEVVRQGDGSYALRQAAAGASTGVLPVVRVNADAETGAGDLPKAYAGGQVARGGRVGLLGNKSVMETPFNTTSYTAQMMEDQQASTVSEVLRADPSVREIFPEGGPAEHFNVRGFYMQTSDFAWNGLFGMVPHNRGATEMLERVEVLKGPGALLYGMAPAGAVGGVVNLVPKRAADEPLTRLTTSYMSDSQLGMHLDLGRRFGEEKQFGIRVNAVKSNGDTALDGQSQDRILGSVALDFRGERVRATLDAYSIEEKQTGGMPLLSTFASSQLAAAPDPTVNTQRGAYSISRSKAVIGAVEFDFNEDWTGFAAAGTKRQTGAGYLNNAIGMNLQTSGAYTAVGMNAKNFFDATSAEVGIRGRFRTGPIGHEVVLSTNAIEQTTGTTANMVTWASNIYSPTTGTRAAEPAVAAKTAEIKLDSIALADTLSFMDRKVLLTLGLRQQRVRTTNFAASGAVSGTPYDSQALTPAVGLVIKPWSAPLSLYANYIEGLSQGATVSDLTSANNGETFAPYKTQQVEFGAKWDAGTFMNTISVFQIERPSLIKDAVTTRYSADGEQRNRGIEWNTAGELARGLRLLGGASYIKAITTRTQSGQYDGKTAIGIPTLQLNLGTEWDVTRLSGLTLRGTAIYTGHQYANSTNTQELPAWTRFDLGARYATRFADHNVVFRGSVINAFDKRYWSGVWNGYAAVGAARTFQLSASVDF